LFERIRDLPRAVFLDSGASREFGGRFDILAADPFVTLTTRGNTTEIRGRDDGRFSTDDPIELVRRTLGPRREGPADLPFSGGAIGYFAYDLARRYERFQGSASADLAMPEMVVGIYDWAIVVDHQRRKSWLASQGLDPATAANRDGILARLASGERLYETTIPFEAMSGVESNLDRDGYGRAFATVQEHITCGNAYQINLTQRFEAQVRGDSWHAYRTLRSVNPAPFSAYLECNDGQILCSSPERFLRVVDRDVETRPIKGTRRRSSNPQVDSSLIADLRASVKDRAENVMIVDLLRNDLGHCCEPGSVRADRLFEVESFASVHQLVSTVTGRLASGYDALDLLRACFPGGSITGAPKVSAMQIIDEVEPHRRSVYCGSIGYVGFDGNMDTNIAIRTLLRYGDRMYAWAGGGIVTDSELEAEYQESFDKADSLLSVLAGARRAANQ